MSWVDLLALYLLKLRLINECDWPFILLVILTMSFEIFEHFLDRGNAHDHGEGEEHNRFAITDGDCVDALHESDDEEVDVRELAELICEYLRKEVENSVFACLHFVTLQHAISQESKESTRLLQVISTSSSLYAATVCFVLYVVVLSH